MQIKMDLTLALERHESSLGTVLYTWLHEIPLKSRSRTKMRPGLGVSRSDTNQLE